MSVVPRHSTAFGDKTGLTLVARLGELVFEAIAEIGDLVQFSWLTSVWAFGRRWRWSVLVPVFHAIGVQSIPVVAITGTFVGMVVAEQAYAEFEMMGLSTRLGSIVNMSVVRELGPVIVAMMLAGRVGASMAAELATMLVTEQIDALWALGTHPIYYLVVPRFLACVLLVPLLTVMGDFMGIIGGAVVSTQILDIDSFAYWKHSRDFVESADILAGVFKSFFFGAAIALVSCQRGLNARPGAEGVGRAATEAFVLSFLAILALDFLLGLGWGNIYNVLYPDSHGML
jgi:phospholipid/cholesterol/gamma-HCH transport system permease protein